MAVAGAWVSLFAYAMLMAAKLFVGHLAHAQSLTADGWNNMTDVVASVAVLIGLIIAKKPRDHDHPYGHYRAENVSSLVISLIMATIGIQVLYSSLRSLLTSSATELPSQWAAWVGLLAAGVMLGVYVFNRRLAQRANSHALDALSKDNLSDALVSLGSVIGVLGARFNLPWLDPLAAVMIGGLIIKTAWGIFVGASYILTDGFDAATLKQYKLTIRQLPGVLAVTDLRGRWQGNNIMLDVTINVDPRLTVTESHRIADTIEDAMKSQHRIYKTLVHVEPAKPHRPESNRNARSETDSHYAGGAL